MSLNEQDKKIILDSIRDVKDFPKKGIVFKDITTLLNNKEAFSLLLNHLYERYKNLQLDFIAGAESRGFIFATPLAQMLKVGFVPIRKSGKLPYTTVSEKYALEYGVDQVEIHIDAFRDIKNPRVLFIDDLIATGGTAEASVKLMKKIGGDVVESCFILELGFLNGKAKVEQHAPVYSVITL